MARIFISYSRNDVAFARRLAASLSDLGAEVWIDVEDIPAGMNWSTAIQQGLDDCDALLLIMSPDSMGSRNVENEWQYVLDQGKPVVPIRWRPAKPHFQLNRLQYHDFYNRDYDQSFRSLQLGLVYKGIDLPAVKPESTSATGPHSAPFVGKTAESPTTRLRGKPIIGGVGIASFLIAILLGVILLNSGGEDDGNNTTPNTVQGDSIADVVEARDDLTNIAQFVAGADSLSSAGSRTFFAPSDVYFAENEVALPTFPVEMIDMIESHTVDGQYTLEELREMDGEELPTLAGTQLRISVSGDLVSINDDFPLTEGDIQAANGVVHIIDGFLWP